MTALELDGVAVDYGTFSLGPLDLSVGDEILSILGPSGCGKTTVLSVVAGIVTDHDGVVRLNGRSLNGLPPEQRHAALVFQDGALFPHMTVQQNIAYAATGDQRVDELASTFEIDDLLSRNAATLSGGERQRVALARALAADPDVLLLDEPLANLDAPVKRRLQFDLRDLLVEFDVPVVYVTHDQEHATTIGDRIAVMRDGQFEQIGTPSDVFERPATRHVAEFTGVSNRFLARVVERSDDGLVLDWHGRRIEAPAYEVSGEDVWFGLRPEYVMVLHEGSTADGRPNLLSGRLERRVFHGDGYRLTFKPDDVPETIEIRLPTPVYERLALGSRDHIRVSLKRSALFVRDRDV